MLGEDDPYLILFTSGTTGRPKGAVLSHRGTIHFIWSSMATGAIHSAIHRLPPMPNPAVTVSSAPLFHVSGMTSQVVLAGASGMTVIYPAARTVERGDAPTAQRGPSGDELGLGAYATVATARLSDAGGLRPVVAGIGGRGGSAVWAPELLRRLGERLPHVQAAVRLGYGMTETTGLGTTLLPPQSGLYPESVGTPSAGVTVEVRDSATGEGAA